MGTWGADGYPSPHLTGVPFNDAYRYMDWLLTVPLLLIEIVLCMKLSPAETSRQCWQLGVSSAVMIAVGYPGELIVTGDFTQRWQCWFFSMCVFLFIVYTLLVGLADATNKEEEPAVNVFPMLGFHGAHAVVGIQCGYCASDIIS